MLLQQIKYTKIVGFSILLHECLTIAKLKTRFYIFNLKKCSHQEGYSFYIKNTMECLKTIYCYLNYIITFLFLMIFHTYKKLLSFQETFKVSRCF